MRPGRLFLGILFSVIYITVTAQIKSVSGTVTDAETKKPLPFSTVINADDYFMVITDQHGKFTISTFSDSSRIVISYIGYKTVEIFAKQAADSIALKKESYNLQTVTVSGEENSITENSTYIGETALSYLQPAGLKDVFQLLPGNITENPDLSKFNAPLIREIDYNNTSSLGTALIIDGMQISTNAKMQTMTTANRYAGVSFINMREFPFDKGNDLRALSTDNIESVNIIKGIPAAQYGDLTNAVVEIKTNIYSLNSKAKLKYNPNITSAGYSKGFKLNANNTVGGNISYTSSTEDVRIPLSHYKRLNIAIGSRHMFKGNQLLTSKISGYYTLDKKRSDRDLIVDNESYTEDNSGLRAILKYQLWNSDKFMNHFDISIKSGIDRELMRIQEYLTYREATAISTSTTNGENIGRIIPFDFLSKYSFNGIPFSLGLNSNIRFSRSIATVNTCALLGTDLNFEQNLGKGFEYKGKYPPVRPEFTPRKQNFSEIPALYHGAVYLEETINKTEGRHRIDAQLGLRQTFYSSHGVGFKTFPEPRLNASYKYLINKNAWLAIHVGYGVQYKIPILKYLHPDNAWFDMISYNQYNTSNPDNSYLVFTTQKLSTQNPDLLPAKSKKAEVGITFNNHILHAVITAFKEVHSDGIFIAPNYINSTYRVYDPGQTVDTRLLPEDQNLSYTITNFYNKYYYPENGVYTLKEGIEYSVKTDKIEPVQTYINLTGAWFRTKTITNSGTVYDMPYYGTSSQFDYIGIYNGSRGKLSERLSSNLRFITHIPRVQLIFSVSVQTIWLYSYLPLRTIEIPVALIDREGNISDFTNEMLRDPYFASYIQTPSESHYLKESFPVISQINMKLSKEIRQKLKVSFLANNIFNNRPLVEQKISNSLIRVNTPLYFGFELSYIIK
ncbi:carboxypeptidase-like regulatory domain-containing protein [Saccharicrinis sp. FJH2]|uniref:carboxypeptidase-like regulatory domain-containing protein n=1 Tax=Saccharicrinis sp. FJH65 TaxID=3344659 RepID=UPI0035F49847